MHLTTSLVTCRIKYPLPKGRRKQTEQTVNQRLPVHRAEATFHSTPHYSTGQLADRSSAARATKTPPPDARMPGQKLTVYSAGRRSFGLFCESSPHLSYQIRPKNAAIRRRNKLVSAITAHLTARQREELRSREVITW